MPLFARPGSLIAFGAVDDQPDYAYAEGVTFRVYELADGREATATVPDLKGRTAARITVSRKARSVEPRSRGPPRDGGSSSAARSPLTPSRAARRPRTPSGS